MTPIELNEQLRKMFDLFPYKITSQAQFAEYLEEAVESIMQRSRSDLRKSLAYELNEIFEFSDLSPATRELAKRELIMAYPLGVDKDKTEEHPLYNMLGLNSDAGGSFNPDESMEISRRLIRECERKGIDTQIAFSNTHKLRDPDLIQARHEFINRWGDEP